MKATSENFILRVLQIAAIALFLGRGWQHLFWDAPYRSLLWDQQLMEGLVILFGYTWENYITSLQTDNIIQNSIKTIGAFYIVCVCITIILPRVKHFGSSIIRIGGISLCVLALLHWKEHFYMIPSLLEYGIQIITPFALISYIRHETLTEKMVDVLRWAIALTFIGHAFFALNIVPRPGRFLDMTMTILNVSEEGAVYFLNVIGVLDLIASVGIFMKKRIAQISLYYLMFWGLATATARLWGNMEGQPFLGFINSMVVSIRLAVTPFFDSFGFIFRITKVNWIF